MARPKKNPTLEATTKIPDGAATAPAPADFSLANGVLDSAKDKFAQALVIGLLPDGNIDIATTNPNYAVLQWLLARAQFELLSHEKQNYLTKK